MAIQSNKRRLPTHESYRRDRCTRDIPLLCHHRHDLYLRWSHDWFTSDKSFTTFVCIGLSRYSKLDSLSRAIALLRRIIALDLVESFWHHRTFTWRHVLFSIACLGRT